MGLIAATGARRCKRIVTAPRFGCLARPSMTPASPLFTGLPADAVQSLLTSLPRRRATPGDVILREGAANGHLCLIEVGEVAVWKGPVEHPEGLQLTTLGAGECFGEMSALQSAPASATLVARTSVTYLEIPADRLPERDGVRSQVLLNLARSLVNRLALTNRSLESKHAAEMETQRRLLASLMMVGRILVTVSIYVFLLPIAAWLKPVLPSDSLISFGFIILLTGMTWGYTRRAGLPSAVFGLDFAGWPRQVWRGVLWTLPWLAAFALIKLAWVHFHPGTVRLFEPERAMNAAQGVNWALWAVFLLTYTAMSFAQEFVRAVVQGALGCFYRTAGRPDRWKSLLIANIVFAILHVHLSPVFAAMAFVSGLLWGWIFQREQSYLAAAASHALAGAWCVFIVGVPY